MKADQIQDGNGGIISTIKKPCALNWVLNRIRHKKREILSENEVVWVIHLLNALNPKKGYMAWAKTLVL